MLPKKKRLSRDAFNRFFSVGKRYRASCFDIVYSTSATFHASVVVPKKVAPKAHDRNALRRRVYASLSRLADARGVYIVIMRPGKGVVPCTEIESELHKAFTALSL
jgi:ribonuclease P protein component